MTHASSLKWLSAGVIVACLGCGSGKEGDTKSPGQTSATAPAAGQASSPTPTATTSAAPELQFQYLSVIREFGPADTAALFAILPSRDDYQITSVEGPRFLGEAHVGELDSEAMKHLFVTSAIPMSADERAAITARYKGAQAIYFEHYNGKLCRGPDNEIKIAVLGKIGTLSVRTTFAFTALPHPQGNCQFHALVTMSHY